jgi:hypothetical protein
MAKASWKQLQELGLRIRRGQISTWKIPAVFGIVEADMLGTYLRFVEETRKEIISAEQVQALIEGKDEALGIFKVTVDYGQTLEQMIAAGKYDGVIRYITPEHFPILGGDKVERELVLVHLNKVATTDEVLAELDRRGLRPAKIEELLVLGALRPELQREFPLVAIGSHWLSPDGYRRFVSLGWRGSERQVLGLFWSDDWAGFCRFLAVRKDAA